MFPPLPASRAASARSAIGAAGLGLFAAIAWVIAGRLHVEYWQVAAAAHWPVDSARIDGVLGAGAIALLLAWARGCPGPWWGSRAAVATGLLLIVAARVLAIVCLDPALASDYRAYHEQAIAILHGGPWLSELRPPGYPLVLAAAYALAGPTPGVGRALNLLLALLAGLLVYGLGRRHWGRGAGTAALWLYALCPSVALMTVVEGSELPYAVALLAGAWALIEGLHADRMRWVALGGLGLGLSQYIRPTSLALWPLFGGLPFLAGLARGRSLKLCLAFGLAFVAVLTPVAVYNHQHGGGVSLSTSNFGGWSLFVGTDARHGGLWNAEDARAIYGATPVEDVRLERLLRQKDREAARRGWDQIARDPARMLALAPRKFAALWNNEDYGADWSIGESRPRETRRLARAQLLSLVYYWVLAIGALVGAWRLRASTPLAILALGIPLVVTAIHLLLEVQARYHAYLTPWLCLLAGYALAGRAIAPGGREPAPGLPGDRAGD